MKILYSLFSRRRFLNGLLAGLGTAFAGTFVGPVVRFVTPPYREPDEVKLPLAGYKDMAPGEVRSFPWGIKPGFLKRRDDGSFLGFVGVCTHLDCNVAYKADQKKFFCACHDGWYDEDGRNIQGPPPTPLRRLTAVLEGEELVVRKSEA
ncbi:MAG: ubiquinol-cytochrome c reductase iron-sulfur subunit [Candidatus Aminicenantes bacterium]|nr:ubiquinol-cytochrome c reductase iron-sulfur subunit [Candidatus Aminicenantes bacterium]